MKLERIDKIVMSIGGLSLLIGLIVGFLIANRLNPCANDLPTSSTETRIIVDTVRLPIPIGVDKGVIRTDKIKPKIKPIDEPKLNEGINTPGEPTNVKGDTPTITETGEMEIPISRKEYKTDKYKLSISGWRPSLDSIEIYEQTKIITNTKIKKPIFSITAGPGIGYDGQAFKPYIGVTAGIILWSK